jgi:hypothetical protein
MASASVNQVLIAKRRSDRIALSAPISLAGEDQASAAFLLNANATNLNLHGAAVQLCRELPVGGTVTIKNKLGAQICARIVAQVSAINEKRTYGIEFVEDSDRSREFWGIRFPSPAA